LTVFDFPSSPTTGQVFNAPTGQGYVYSGTAWNLAQTSPQAPVASDNPPANPYAGQLWLRSTTGALYMWFVDPTSSQWIQIPGVFMPGGVAGVTDGSNAAAGMVGEFISLVGSSTTVSNNTATNVTGTQMTLQPGDWDVWGTAQFGLTTASGLNAGISMASNTLQNYAAMNATSAIFGACILPVPRLRVSVATATTVWLVGQINGGTGTLNVNGSIYARRMR
jgi:hypothetical protein